MFKLNLLKKCKWYKAMPHLKAMVVDNINSRRTGAWQRQGLAMPFFPKKYTFYKKWAWQASKAATSFIFRNINVHYQGFKMKYCLFVCDSWF